jgi:hypothetical protein
MPGLTIVYNEQASGLLFKPGHFWKRKGLLIITKMGQQGKVGVVLGKLECINSVKNRVSN